MKPSMRLRSFDHGGVGAERLNCRFKRCAKNKDLHSVLYQCSVQRLILNSNSIGVKYSLMVLEGVGGSIGLCLWFDLLIGHKYFFFLN